MKSSHCIKATEKQTMTQRVQIKQRDQLVRKDWCHFYFQRLYQYMETLWNH